MPEKINIPGPVFKFVEYKLYNYRANKTIVDSVTERQGDILNKAKQRPDAGGPAMGAEIISSTERKAVALILEEERATLQAPWVRLIEQVFYGPKLDDVDQQLVQLKYFDALLNDKGIIKQLPMSERTYYRRRKEIIYEFAKGFGLMA